MTTSPKQHQRHSLLAVTAALLFAIAWLGAAIALVLR